MYADSIEGFLLILFANLKFLFYDIKYFFRFYTKKLNYLKIYEN